MITSTRRTERLAFIMRGDGNFVLYNNRNGQALWASNTWNTPVNHAIIPVPAGHLARHPSSKASAIARMVTALTSA